MNEYKTFEELKEELGDKFEEYMYGANINLLNNWNKLKEWLEEEIKHLEKSRYVSFNEYGENKLRISKEFLFKMQELEKGGMNE